MQRNSLRTERDTVLGAPHQHDPYPFYAALRERCEGLASCGPEGALVAARAAAVEEILNNVDIVAPPVANALAAGVGEDLLDGFYARLLMFRDDPRAQSVRRRLVFPLREAAGMRGRARAALVASRLADAYLKPQEAPDIEEFCERLPIGALAHIMGAPLSLALGLSPAIERLAAPLSRTAPKPSAKALEADYRRVCDILERHIGFLDDSFGGAAPAVSVDDLLATLIGLYLQSHEATSALLLSCVRHHAAGCGEGLDLLEPVLRQAFIEEVERFDPPVQLVDRVAQRATTAAGRQIGAGEKIIALIGAANRDPSANLDPDCFNLYRVDRRSFAFSAGRHACPGRRLAMMVADVGMETLLLRVPSIERRVVHSGFRVGGGVRRPTFQLRDIPALVENS
jgi:cytochrome P450